MERESTLTPRAVGIRLAATRPSSRAQPRDYVEKQRDLTQAPPLPPPPRATPRRCQAGNSRHDGTRHDRGDRHAEEL